jgi:hypothetical protein
LGQNYEFLQISEIGKVLEGLRVDVQQVVGLFNSTVKEEGTCK